MLKILLTGGGTGGHIQPALALWEAFLECREEVSLAFCGTKNGMEEELALREGIPFYGIKMQGLRRNLSLSNFKTVYLTLCSFRSAGKIISDFKPDIVIGTGGYVCYPFLRSAYRKGIFSVLHESNAIPGLTAKLLAPHMDIVYTNFLDVTSAFSKAETVRCMGNPLRSAFQKTDKKIARKRLKIDPYYKQIIFSYGGSLGATILNQLIIERMKIYGKMEPHRLHIHVCGKRDYPKMKELFIQYGLDKYKNLILKDYLFDLPNYLCASDLVVCRAGAMSLSELAICEKPSILIPSPNVTHNHQYHNAMAFMRAGAGICIEESKCTVPLLQEKICMILSSDSTYLQMANAAKNLSTPYAAKKIAKDILESQKRKKF